MAQLNHLQPELYSTPGYRGAYANPALIARPYGTRPPVGRLFQVPVPGAAECLTLDEVRKKRELESMAFKNHDQATKTVMENERAEYTHACAEQLKAREGFHEVMQQASDARLAHARNYFEKADERNVGNQAELAKKFQASSEKLATDPALQPEWCRPVHPSMADVLQPHAMPIPQAAMFGHNLGQTCDGQHAAYGYGHYGHHYSEPVGMPSPAQRIQHGGFRGYPVGMY